MPPQDNDAVATGHSRSWQRRSCLRIAGRDEAHAKTRSAGYRVFDP